MRLAQLLGEISAGLVDDFSAGRCEDDSEALRWYRMAAKQGNVDAQCNIGFIYLFRLGESDQHSREALRWYRKGAKRGYDHAQWCVGLIYLDGRGVTRDVGEALRWFRKAAAQSTVYAEKLSALETTSPPNQGDAEMSEALRESMTSPGGNERLQAALEKLDAMIGLAAVKEQIRSLVNLARAQDRWRAAGMRIMPVSLHLVFTGNPGTGKTSVARLVGEIYAALGLLKTDHVVEVDRGGLCGGYLGQTALKTAECIDKALDGILFIDEAYALARGGAAGRDYDYGLEAIDTLLKRMEDDRERLAVIVAGYTEPMKHFIGSNPGLQSRFTRYIEFPDYSAGELIEIFIARCSEAGFVFGAGTKKRIIQVITALHSGRDVNFGNARVIRTLFEATMERQAARLNHDEDADSTLLQPDDIPEPTA